MSDVKSEAEAGPEAEPEAELDANRPAAVERLIARWPGPQETNQRDMIAEEVPVALVYNGVSHAVMMASPLDLRAFAVGFSLTEGIVDHPDDIYGVAIARGDAGIEVSITLSNRCFARLKKLRRNLVGQSGCGLCGAESLEQLRQDLPVATATFTLSHGAVNMAARNLTEHQPLQALSGAVHGAAWCDTRGYIVKVCEDVGRHNALDKLIGSLYSGGAFAAPGFLLMTSRASYEILAKAAQSGIAVVVAVSAPTSLAIDVAAAAGITLVGFSRDDRHVVYTNGQRLSDTIG